MDTPHGKYPVQEDVLTVIMESSLFLPMIAQRSPFPQIFNDYISKPGILEGFSDSIVLKLPFPRQNYYQSSDFDTVQ